MSVIGQGAQTFLPNNPHTVILFVPGMLIYWVSINSVRKSL